MTNWQTNSHRLDKSIVSPALHTFGPSEDGFQPPLRRSIFQPEHSIHLIPTVTLPSRPKPSGLGETPRGGTGIRCTHYVLLAVIQ